MFTKVQRGEPKGLTLIAKIVHDLYYVLYMMSCYLCAANTCHKDASQLYHTLVNKKAGRLLYDLVALYAGRKYQASPLSWVNFPTEQFEKEGVTGKQGYRWGG